MWFYLLYIVRIEIEVEFLNWLSNFFENRILCVYMWGSFVRIRLGKLFLNNNSFFFEKVDL